MDEILQRGLHDGAKLLCLLIGGIDLDGKMPHHAVGPLLSALAGSKSCPPPPMKCIGIPAPSPYWLMALVATAPVRAAARATLGRISQLLPLLSCCGWGWSRNRPRWVIVHRALLCLRRQPSQELKPGDFDTSPACKDL
mgnify:CR=1 FL=1